MNLPFGHSSRNAHVTCPSVWPLADRPAQAQPCHGSHSPAWENMRLARPSEGWSSPNRDGQPQRSKGDHVTAHHVPMAFYYFQGSHNNLTGAGIAVEPDRG